MATACPTLVEQSWYLAHSICALSRVCIEVPRHAQDKFFPSQILEHKGVRSETERAFEDVCLRVCRHCSGRRRLCPQRTPATVTGTLNRRLAQSWTACSVPSEQPDVHLQGEHYHQPLSRTIRAGNIVIALYTGPRLSEQHLQSSQYMRADVPRQSLQQSILPMLNC